MEAMVKTTTGEKLEPMPLYRCHKVVHALKIVGVHPGESVVTQTDKGDAFRHATWSLEVEPPFAPLCISDDWYVKHLPEAGGYFVRYEDGYTSYSPAKAFEDGYTLIP